MRTTFTTPKDWNGDPDQRILTGVSIAGFSGNAEIKINTDPNKPLYQTIIKNPFEEEVKQ